MNGFAYIVIGDAWAVQCRVRELELNMQLRIFRTWRWVADFVPMIGQKAPMHLEATDEVQYRNHKDEWLPLPVVEAEKPEHPDAAEERRRTEEMQDAVDRLIANWSIKFHNV